MDQLRRCAGQRAGDLRPALQQTAMRPLARARPAGLVGSSAARRRSRFGRTSPRRGVPGIDRMSRLAIRAIQIAAAMRHHRSSTAVGQPRASSDLPADPTPDHTHERIVRANALASSSPQNPRLDRRRGRHSGRRRRTSPLPRQRSAQLGLAFMSGRASRRSAWQSPLRAGSGGPPAPRAAGHTQGDRNSISSLRARSAPGRARSSDDSRSQR